MAYTQKLTTFAQKVYLTVNGSYLDDIASTDGQNYIAQVIDWLNGYLDELETTVDPYGQPVCWNFLRTQDYNFGTANAGDSTVDLDDEVLQVVATEKRPVKIVKDGQTVSEWKVVSANQIGSDPSKLMVAKVGTLLFFSRSFNDNEDGGDILGDVAISLDRATSTNDSALAVAKPFQLLVLGVAKNSVLPDIVQGGLTPTFVQKYNDLLQASILVNNATSDSDYVDRDDNGYISGLY